MRVHACSGCTKLTGATIGISDGAYVVPGALERSYDAGVRHVRFQVDPDDLAAYDRVIWRSQELGMHITVSPLGRHVDGAAKVVRRWPAVDAVSVFNEPEINGYRDDPCSYVAFHIRAVSLVKQVRRVPVIFGENSPHAALTWLKGLSACPGANRLRPKVWGVHPYQWSTDPLSPKQDDAQDGKGDWIGIGRLGRVMRWWNKKTTKRAFGIKRAPEPVVTEFGYLHGERYGSVSAQQAAAWWPRALRQCDRVGAKVIYAQGAVTPMHEERNWNSPIDGATITKLASAS